MNSLDVRLSFSSRALGEPTKVTRGLHISLRQLLPAMVAMFFFTLPLLGVRLECRLEVPVGHSVPRNAQIELRMASGSLVGSAVVEGNGSAIFDRVPGGSYTVAVRAEGYLPATQNVEVPGYIGSSLFTVSIRMSPEPQPEGRPPGEKTVPVRSLQVPEEAIEEVQAASKAAARGSLEEAIEHAGKAVEIYPAFFEAYYNLAVYEYRAGRPQKAVEFFGRALLLNPDAVGANANLGRILLDVNRPKEALPYLEHAAKVNPTSAQIQYHLARAFILSSAFSESVKPLKLALELQPPVAHARFLLAHVLLQLGDIPGAVKQLGLYLKTKPKNERELQKTLSAWEAQAKKRK